VPKATSARVFAGDPELEEAVIEAAKALEAQGVRGISSDCGYFINYQDAVARAVRIPVYLSSLLQLPFISACIGRSRPIGIICANAGALGNRVLEMTGLGNQREVLIKGMRDEPIFGSSVTGDCVQLDPDLIEQEVVAVARRMLNEQPELGAILIECSMLPPYARAVQDATGLPVFDFLTMIDYHEKAAHRRGYEE